MDAVASSSVQIIESWGPSVIASMLHKVNMISQAHSRATGGQRRTDNQARAVKKSDAKDLAWGWRKHWSARKGQHFFSHKHAQLSVWEQPTPLTLFQAQMRQVMRHDATGPQRPSAALTRVLQLVMAGWMDMCAPADAAAPFHVLQLVAGDLLDCDSAAQALGAAHVQKMDMASSGACPRGRDARPALDQIESPSPAATKFQLIVSFCGLNFAWMSAARANMFMHTLACQLAPGGAALMLHLDDDVTREDLACAPSKRAAVVSLHDGDSPWWWWCTSAADGTDEFGKPVSLRLQPNMERPPVCMYRFGTLFGVRRAQALASGLVSAGYYAWPCLLAYCVMWAAFSCQAVAREPNAMRRRWCANQGPRFGMVRAPSVVHRPPG